jgi:hypothetical protein
VADNGVSVIKSTTKPFQAQMVDAQDPTLLHRSFLEQPYNVLSASGDYMKMDVKIWTTAEGLLLLVLGDLFF